MRLVVASTRPAKVQAAHAAIHAISAIDPRFAATTIEELDVSEIAPAMPLSDRDTLAGAVARAAAVLARATGPVLALGLEGGITRLPVGEPPAGAPYALASWAAATDGAMWGYGSGGAILLPDFIARQVIGGRELGDVIDRLAAAPVRGTRGAWGVCTRDLIGRRDAYLVATLAALAPFYNADLYGRRTADRSS
jgi:inosine/xanthosine triphosphatase